MGTTSAYGRQQSSLTDHPGENYDLLIKYVAAIAVQMVYLSLMLLLIFGRKDSSWEARPY